MFRFSRSLLAASAAALFLAGFPRTSFVAPACAQANIVTNAPFPPPTLPIYAQPPIPGPGYLWVPGYWAWDGTEYYWAPGYWQAPPEADLYWTPGYWAWNPAGNNYVFIGGYWGPQVGYCGGIAYGFGYTGVGYSGGYWRNNAFVYNRAANNLGRAKVPTFANEDTPSSSHVSFAGGAQGTTAKPTEAELAAAHASHVAMTLAQIRRQEAASRIPALRYRENKGAPPVTATLTANDLQGASRSELPLAHEVAGAPTVGPRVDNASRALASTLARHPNPQSDQATGAIRNFAAHTAAIRSPATAPDYAFHAPQASDRRDFESPARIAAPAAMRVSPPPVQNIAFHAPAARFGAVGGGFYNAPVSLGAPNVRIAIPSTPVAPLLGAPNVGIAAPGMHIGGGMHAAGFHGGASGGAIGTPVGGFYNAPVSLGAPNVRIAIPSTPVAPHVGAPNVGIAAPGMHVGGGMHAAGFDGAASGVAIGTPVGGFRAP